jgi:queuosine biosynthesis protein QueD
MSESPAHVLRADGGARGNPGPAAAAFILEGPDGVRVAQDATALGVTTNNVAEYSALIMGLAAAVEAGVEDVDVLLDSELVVKQLNGEYRVKKDTLKGLFAEARGHLERIPNARIAHVRREENAAADALVNEILDSLAAGEEAKAPSAGGRWELSVKDHFDAAHALEGYPGECRELHGHTWDVEVTVAGRKLDEVGIVYDFKTLKDDLRAALDPFDHAHLNEVPPFDTLNPTAENLAKVVFEALGRRVGKDVSVLEVSVWESPIARITFRPDRG